MLVMYSALPGRPPNFHSTENQEEWLLEQAVELLLSPLTPDAVSGKQVVLLPSELVAPNQAHMNIIQAAFLFV